MRKLATPLTPIAEDGEAVVKAAEYCTKAEGSPSIGIPTPFEKAEKTSIVVEDDSKNNAVVKAAEYGTAEDSEADCTAEKAAEYCADEITTAEYCAKASDPPTENNAVVKAAEYCTAERTKKTHRGKRKAK